MAKDRERRLAHGMYVEQGKTGRDIAQLLQVQEKTVSAWVTEGGWKAERDARINSTQKCRADLERVIADLAEERLEISQMRKQAQEDGDTESVRQLNKAAAALADQISKHSKALQAFDKESRISLAIYLEVMDDLFTNLRAQDEKLYLKTLDFQESHVHFISKKLG